MLRNRALALAVGLAVLPQIVHAAESAAHCVDASVPKHAAEAHRGKWIELTSDQWQFLRGIYAMNPLTPQGLPYGDKACTPMAVPDQLLSMMDDVATAKISHEGSAL